MYMTHTLFFNFYTNKNCLIPDNLKMKFQYWKKCFESHFPNTTIEKKKKFKKKILFKNSKKKYFKNYFVIKKIPNIIQKLQIKNLIEKNKCLKKKLKLLSSKKYKIEKNIVKKFNESLLKINIKEKLRISAKSPEIDMKISGVYQIIDENLNFESLN
jgi:hypothetical protein